MALHYLLFLLHYLLFAGVSDNDLIAALAELEEGNDCEVRSISSRGSSQHHTNALLSTPLATVSATTGGAAGAGDQSTNTAELQVLLHVADSLWRV